LHGTQELDGEQRVTSSPSKERLAESLIQGIGLAVQEAVHEEAALRLIGRGQVVPSGAGANAQLGQGRLQRMPLPIPPPRQFVRPVRPNQEDTACPDPPAQVN
jgi:hypothetical protein